MRVILYCRYPGMDLPPTVTAFTPASCMGATPEEVHGRLTALLSRKDYIEIPVDGDLPMPLWRETLQRLEVRE